LPCLWVGISISRNEIRNDMEAYILNAGDAINPVMVTAGDILVEASEIATIDSSSVASAIGVAASLNADSLAFSAGGASALNVILGTSNAYIQGSIVKASGADKGTASLTATNSSTIDSTVKTTAVSVALSGGGSAKAFGIGFSFAANMIGWSDLFTEDRLEVLAYAKDSDIIADNGISLSSSGLVTINKVSTDVQAYIDGDTITTDITTTGGDVSLTAIGTTKITADAQAVAVSASLSGKTGGAVSIGLSIADNSISNTVAAYINKANVLTDGGDIIVEATDKNATTGDTTSIEAKSIAVAVSAGIGKNGFALSGGGAESTNIILTTTNAYIEDSTLGSVTNKVGNVDLDATRSPHPWPSAPLPGSVSPSVFRWRATSSAGIRWARQSPLITPRTILQLNWTPARRFRLPPARWRVKCSSTSARR